MSVEILLDYEGDVKAPEGFQVIECEVDFLRYAVSSQSLLIRGARLCQWAQDFYDLRGLPVTTIESPRAALRRVFSLSSEQAKELAEKIEPEYLSIAKLSAAFVLGACFPKDLPLWRYDPSSEHAARWLLWQVEHTPSEAEAIIFDKFASEMQVHCNDASLEELYRAQDKSQALNFLFRWLGAEEGSMPTWGEFPLELPDKWLRVIMDAWMKRIIKTDGNFFAQMLSFPLPLALRQKLAGQTALYFSKHSHQLTRMVLQQLQPYLPPSDLVTLEKHLPPTEPDSLPQDETEVLDWFEHQYLPYRRWQARFGKETATQTVVEHAQTFARWLLEHYPRWLLEGEHLVFQKSARLADPNSLTLCIILDGLPAWDAELLVQELSVQATRLTLLQKKYCFTALPTVTEFAKEALLRGVPPRDAPQVPTLGSILPDNLSPKIYLKEARAGQIWFWRVEQPDKAYHFEKDDKRERQIYAEIKSIIQEIAEVVQTIPDNLPLKILITSDHGRLMNPRSPRQLPVEEGMEAHGRAAWGSFQRHFPETGFEIDEQNGWVELYGERFGMTHNLRLSWGEASFAQTSGIEAYPHGGLFPEEVIVPWFIFQRDAQPPALEINLTGTGEADMSGKVLVSILNQSPLALECRQVRFSHGVTLNIAWQIPPLSELLFNVSLTPWPPKSAQGKVTAAFLFFQPNGAIFTKETNADLQINVLYDRSDDLLKDLDL